MDARVYEFDVALSFAGEDRAHAEGLAKLLRDSDVRVFYDEFVKSTLWGKDLYQHLETIYKDQAKYCVVFVSEAYIKKNWTKHELRQAQARSFASDREYILPLRVDDAVLPGLPPTIGYLDLRSTTLERGRLGPCGDCAALPGQYHAPNCDMEQCPACGGQALSCDCQLEFMSPSEIAEWIVDGALDEDNPP
jgi:TIR domain